MSISLQITDSCWYFIYFHFLAPWDAKKKKLEREKAVTDLILKKDKTTKDHKDKKAKEMSFSQVEKLFRSKVLNYVEILEFITCEHWISYGYHVTGWYKKMDSVTFI